MWTNFFTAIHCIDNTVHSDKLRKANLSKTAEFLRKHCKATHYAFQYKKCTDDGCWHCRIISPPRLLSKKFSSLSYLPDAVIDSFKMHCKPFSELYGTDTTEKDRPSFVPLRVAKCGSGAQGTPHSRLGAECNCLFWI